jgi:hypothetical protein
MQQTALAVLVLLLLAGVLPAALLLTGLLIALLLLLAGLLVTLLLLLVRILVLIHSLSFLLHMCPVPNE